LRFKGWAEWAHDMMIPTDRGAATKLDALVVGAGFAGLYQLLCLRDRLGLSVLAVEAGVLGRDVPS
jgi:hypothetical protein